MKNVILLSILALCTLVAAHGATKIDPSTFKTDSLPEPMLVCDHQPEFMLDSTGTKVIEFKNWAQQNVIYPQLALEDGIQGRVRLSFIVEVDGTTSNVQVLRGANPHLNQAARDVILKSPKWHKPGYDNGKPVRMYFIIPIDFILSQ